MKKKLNIVLFLCILSSLATAQVQLKICPVFNASSLFKQEPKTDSISVLRFYVSSVQLFFQDGTKHTEPRSYHLMDLEEAESFIVHLKAPNNPIAKVLFHLGIDSITSTSGALDGVLDPVKGMYWAWQSGYINFKLEGKSQKCNTSKKEFVFHIGGYSSPFYALRKIEIPVHYQENGLVKIEMNLNTLLSSLDLSKTNSVMIPGREAMQVADLFQNMFSNK